MTLETTAAATVMVFIASDTMIKASATTMLLASKGSHIVIMPRAANFSFRWMQAIAVRHARHLGIGNFKIGFGKFKIHFQCRWGVFTMTLETTAAATIMVNIAP